MDKWTSVEDSLPAIGQPVILFSNGDVQNEIYTLDAGDVSDYETEYFWINNHIDCSEESYKVDPKQYWMALPHRPDIKSCANCGKENPVKDMKVCMHAGMHRYVCDSKCMREFYR